MPRIPKPGEFFNCKLSQELVDKLNAYAEKTRLPKTVIVELALEEYFQKVMPETKETERQI